MKSTFRKILFFIIIATASLNAESATSRSKAENVLMNQDSMNQHSQQTISSEITNLKETDPYIQKYEKIEDYGLKLFLNYIQKAKIVADSEEKEEEQIKINFIYDFQPTFNEAVHLNQEQAPKLHALINNLAQKANIKAPKIFLSLHKKLSNAWAMTYSKDLSCIILCENLIKNMTDDELKAIIAHEIGHIKNDSVKKVSALDKYMSQKNILILQTAAFASICTLIALSKFKTKNFLKNNMLLSSGIGTLLATPFIGLGIFIYWFGLKQHNPTDEVNADKVAIDITNDPTSFINAMQVLKNQYIKEFGTIENGFEIVDENLEDLKNSSESWFNKLKTAITLSKSTIEANKKNIIENGCVSHPGIDKRIEFGKQELEKQLQLAQA